MQQQNEAKPVDDSLTLNPPKQEQEDNKEEKKSKTFQALEEKWKDEYSKIGDIELDYIIKTADAMTDSYTFSDKVRRYTPIRNKKWREMTAKRRQWQNIQAKSSEQQTDSDSLDRLESMIHEYYAEMCNIYFGMTREEYDELPPAETQQAVEVGNHKTQHPLGAKPPSSGGLTQQ